jgi:hypothetical protein
MTRAVVLIAYALVALGTGVTASRMDVGFPLAAFAGLTWPYAFGADIMYAYKIGVLTEIRR